MAEHFEIKRGAASTVTGTVVVGATISGTLPNQAMPIGTPLQISAVDAATELLTFALASGRADGFVTRETRVGPGLTDSELVDQSFGLLLAETPFEAGKNGSIETAQALVVCGDGTNALSATNYVKGSSTGAVTSGTAADTKLSFQNGLFYVAQTGDWASYRVVAQLTPLDGETCRLYLEKISAYVV